MSKWPGAPISPAGVEGVCGEMFVDVACPKSCELGDVHETLLNGPFSSEKIDDQRWRRNDGSMTVVDGGEEANEVALEQGSGWL